MKKTSTLLSGDKGRQQKEMVGELASILISVVSTLPIMIITIIIILISVSCTLVISVLSGVKVKADQYIINNPPSTLIIIVV